jgi:hypothetical protein
VLLQLTSWRVLWWASTAITAAPLPLVALGLPPDEPRGAAGVAAATARIGGTIRSIRPWIAGVVFGCFTTSLLTFAVDWAAWPGGAIWEFTCLIAFSFSGAAVPATLFRIAVDLAPPAGSTTATIGLMQQIFNAGSVAGPALVAWLVTLTRNWQATWWMTCAFAALGGLLSGYLSERRLGLAFSRTATARLYGILAA